MRHLKGDSKVWNTCERAVDVLRGLGGADLQQIMMEMRYRHGREKDLTTVRRLLEERLMGSSAENEIGAVPYYEGASERGKEAKHR